MPLPDMAATMLLMANHTCFGYNLKSIQVSSLLETMETLIMTRQNNSQWTRLQCCLSSPEQDCAAVIVNNCYIVILGGGNAGISQDLSLVDIKDTAPPPPPPPPQQQQQQWRTI